MKRLVRTLAIVSAAGMFLVLVMGATVTNTGSEHGCGRSWPLCHGQLIPQFAVSTFIEFSHRAIVGVESVLVIALAVLALAVYRNRREIQILAPVMVLFLFLQAGLGAWAVMAPQLSAVLALHFGVSLISFASVLLTAIYVFEIDGWDALRDRPAPAPFRALVWGLAAYSYVVVYLGAYVRHTNADDGCTGWPLCNGSLLPGLHGATSINVVHRFAAGILVLGLAVLVVRARRLRHERPDLYRAGLIAFGMVVIQALAGAAVAWTNMDLFSALAHAASAGLLFGSLTYLCMHVLPRPVSERARGRSGETELRQTFVTSR